MNSKYFEERLKALAAGFHPVVPLGQDDGLVPMDFTSANRELTPEILADTTAFSAWVDEKLAASKARYGIGGYAEHRTIYSRSEIFDGEQEPRRFHLGVDIWGEAGTDVHAPLQGTVHSFGFNSGFGDYGATLILEHQLNDLNFYTLYGHLSLASIRDKREGQMIEKGEWIAAFGIPEENGHWPPHLHFQVILDIGDWRADYPGVCKFSEREQYLANCPDPDILLNMMQFVSK
jgi:peptidoglycan LD-endopeptidase LytH